MITISPLKNITDKQISEMLTLSCTAMEFTIETDSLLRESPPQFSILLGVIEGVFKMKALLRPIVVLVLGSLGSLRYGDYGLRLQLNMLLRMIVTVHFSHVVLRLR